jgi:hypothetical protein
MDQVSAPAPAFDGVATASTRIGPNQIAVFPFTIPAGMKSGQIEFFQKGDDTDRTHRNAWLSKVPGYSTPVESRPNKPMAPDGKYPGGVQFARDTQGGAIELIVDGQAYVEVSNHGSRIVAHVAEGEIWYMNVANDYGKAKHPGGDANVTVIARKLN